MNPSTTKKILFTDIMNEEVTKFLQEYFRNIETVTSFDLINKYYYIYYNRDACYVNSSDERPNLGIDIVNVSSLVQRF